MPATQAMLLFTPGILDTAQYKTELFKGPGITPISKFSQSPEGSVNPG